MEGLTNGEDTVIFCHAGLGRSGTVAACVLASLEGYAKINLLILKSVVQFRNDFVGFLSIFCELDHRPILFVLRVIIVSFESKSLRIWCILQNHSNLNLSI